MSRFLARRSLYETDRKFESIRVRGATSRALPLTMGSGVVFFCGGRWTQ